MRETEITHKEIREYLGHDGSNCKVMIGRDKKIFRKVHPDPFNRTRDYKHFVGYLDDIKNEMQLAGY